QWGPRDGQRLPLAFTSHPSSLAASAGRNDAPVRLASTWRLSVRLERQQPRWDLRLQAVEYLTDRLQVARMDADMLGDGVHIPERALDRAGRVKGGCAARQIDQVHSSGGAGHRVPGRQTHLRPRLDRR